MCLRDRSAGLLPRLELARGPELRGGGGEADGPRRGRAAPVTDAQQVHECGAHVSSALASLVPKPLASAVPS